MLPAIKHVFNIKYSCTGRQWKETVYFNELNLTIWFIFTISINLWKINVNKLWVYVFKFGRLPWHRPVVDQLLYECWYFSEKYRTKTNTTLYILCYQKKKYINKFTLHYTQGRLVIFEFGNDVDSIGHRFYRHCRQVLYWDRKKGYTYYARKIYFLYK